MQQLLLLLLYQSDVLNVKIIWSTHALRIMRVYADCVRQTTICYVCVENRAEIALILRHAIGVASVVVNRTDGFLAYHFMYMQLSMQRHELWQPLHN